MTESTENLPAPLDRARAVLGFDSAKAELAELAQQSTAITEITNKAGYDQCHAARMRLKNRRLDIQKAGKAAREDAQKYSKAVIQVENDLVAIITPEEDRLESIQRAYDAEREAERQAAERAEQERIQRQQDAIATITGALGRLFNASVEELDLALQQLGDFDMDQFDDVYLPAAERARDEAVAAITRAREQRIELDRQAAEQRRREEELAEQERQAAARRESEERQRQAAERVQRAIEDLRRAGFSGGATSEQLKAAVDRLAGEPLTADVYGERLQEAEQARSESVAALQERLQSVLADEERARALAEREAEIERQERERAEQQRLQEEAERVRPEEERRKAEQQRMEQERAEAERRDQERLTMEQDAIDKATLIEAATEALGWLRYLPVRKAEDAPKVTLTARKLDAAISRYTSERNT